jgi:lipoprotein-anchoring transpeptidase ErfK/SrfK
MISLVRGTIVVDPPHHYLYYVEGGGNARRYGIAVGGEGFGWSGVATVHSKQEWPDWYPTKEILERHPELRAGFLKELPSGQGGPAGPTVRSVPARFTYGKAKRTPCTASMAQTSHGRSGATFPPAAFE